MMKRLYTIIACLFLFVNTYANNAYVVVDTLQSKARASFEKIEATNRWVNNFSNQDLVELPIGIRKTINNSQYAIGISKAVFTPEYTILTVFCKIDLPQTNADGTPMQLFFGANDVKLSHSGGLIGDAKLVLLGDVDVPFNANKWQVSLYGGMDMTTGNVADLTYVTIDCDGFKDLRVTGAVEFSRDLILPLEANGIVNEAKTTVMKTYPNGVTKQVPYRVKGDFSFEASNWNDIMVNVNLQPFVLKTKRNGSNFDGNIQFLVNNAVFDFSDINNHPTVRFPEYYTDNGLLMPSINAWRGVFIETLNIGLPKEFKTVDSQGQQQRINIGASNLIIDKYGVSGTFYADNVFPLDKGITSEDKAWAYSLDHIDITIAANTFVKANLDGEILLPISKQSTTQKKSLNYNGFISQQEQRLAVVTNDDLHFDVWKAKAVILPNSSVELKVADGKFLPKANLHGALTISTNQAATDDEEVQGNRSIDFDGVTFQNLQLQTVSPVMTVDNMGYSGTFSFSNFPVSIGNINVSVHDTNARLDFDLGLNLMESIGAGATARIGVKGKLHQSQFKQKWKYDGLDLSAIAINCEFSGMKMNGLLQLMENDPVYGNGFNAELDVDVVNVVNVRAKAIFGKTSYRYWYFDAAANWPATPSPFMINGFAGGAYYKMRRSPNVAISEFSPSGLSYIPDDSRGLGVKALVYFHVGKEEVCDGEAGFEVAFNNSGGINTLAIFGKANIVAKLPGMKNVNNLMNKVASSANGMEGLIGDVAPQEGSFASNFLPKAQKMIPGEVEGAVGIRAVTAIEFDFQNRSMHGTLDVYINTPNNTIAGIGQGGRAGWAVFHKDPKDWYLYIGTPDDRCGVKIGVGGMHLKTHSYFMAGTQLPGSPPPPAIVSQILGVDAEELNYMRDENALANAGGLAFGGGLDFDTGDLRFLIFYARFQAGIGFDIMLKDYGEARCSNTGEEIGINGWYANGQSYAYLQGELGVRVKLLFVRMKIPIISGGAAVLLQAKLPNPVWLRGYVGGHMNILGGLIKGRFRFKMTIGEECQFENASVLGGIKLIASVSPKDNSSDVDVFAVPQATFTMKVNEPIVVPEDHGEQTYKVVLEKFQLLDDGVEIPNTIEWNNMKDRANLVSTDILPPNKKLKVVVELSFQKLVNGVYEPIKVDGQIVKEIEERTFTTGTAPDYIPLTNIEYSYPVVDQKYFYEKEYDKGYIQLKRGQDYLFEDSNWETKVQFAKADEPEDVKQSVFGYNTTTNEVSYDLPNIDQRQKYVFAITSNIKAGTSNEGATTTETAVLNDDDENGNNITMTQNQAQATSQDGAVERLKYEFATSRYKTFKKKMDAINTKNYNFGVLTPDVIYLSNTINSNEAFDLPELEGTKYTDNIPLIKAEANLVDEYFNTDINPPLYGQYPIGNSYEITHRDTEDLGLTPIRALPLNAYYMASLEHDTNDEWVKSNFPFKYNLPLTYRKDWANIKNQVVNDYVANVIDSSHPAFYFIDQDFLFMRYGFYEVKLSYKLPGDKKAVDYIYKFKNTNDFR